MKIGFPDLPVLHSYYGAPTAFTVNYTVSIVDEKPGNFLFLQLGSIFDSFILGMACSLIGPTMGKYNINTNLVPVNEHLYYKIASAVQMNGSMGERFRTTVGARQGCLFLPIIVNIFREK